MLLLNEEKHTNEKYSGWILYTLPESIRNRHYIDLYRKACRKYGMSVTLIIYEPECEPDSLYIRQFSETGCDAGKGWKPEELIRQEKPVFAVNRTRDYRLAQKLEASGVRVYNNSQIAEIGNDKAKAYRYMERHGIPVMPVVYETETIPVRYPVVVKSCAGHGGTEVFLINSVSEWMRWKQISYQDGKKYVVQQAASDLGKDLRVYVVGNQIAASVMRSSRHDFRSNASLGGQAQLYELCGEQRRLTEYIISQFHIGMAGIDFVFHQGRMIFNEIEDMAGARMLYSLTNYDIVDAYVKFIWENLQQ